MNSPIPERLSFVKLLRDPIKVRRRARPMRGAQLAGFVRETRRVERVRTSLIREAR